MAAEHGTSLLQDPHFWVFLATVIFAFVAFQKGKKPLLDLLDKRSSRIRDELEEAERLRSEAHHLLTEYQRKHRDALHTAQQIIENARETASRIRAEAEEALDETLKRRELQLAERIKRAEITAITEIRNQAADIAIGATEKILREQLSHDGGKLVDKAALEVARQAG